MISESALATVTSRCAATGCSRFTRQCTVMYTVELVGRACIG